MTALVYDYRGSAHLQLGDESGEAELLASIELSRRIANSEFELRGYYNLVEGLWRLGHYERAAHYLDQAEDYVRDRDFPAHSYMFRARRLRLLAASGHWAEAMAGLEEMLDGAGDPGMIGRETIPAYARLLVRLGDPRAAETLALAREHAERADVLEWLGPTGAAVLEHAWLTGADPGTYPERLMERLTRPGTPVWRGDVARYLRRLGRPVVPFDDCPPAYAAGLRGDWRQAAELWRAAGDPYEEALELADSGEVAPTLEALRLLDALGAEPAATLVRGRLVALGVSRPPRGIAAEYPGKPRRPHRSPARDPSPGRNRDVQRGDRSPAGRVDPDRRPPRLGHPPEARGPDPPRRGRPAAIPPAHRLNTGRPAVVLPPSPTGEHPMSISTATTLHPSITVRPATKADHPRVRAVVTAAYGPLADILPADLFRQMSVDLLDLERHARLGRLLVAEIDGNISGSVVSYPDSSLQAFGWPERWSGGRGLAVDPAARGLGIAQRLLEQCERLGRDAGAPVFAFHTTAAMTAAVRLYDHLGYRRAPKFDVDLAEHYGLAGLPPLPALAYLRAL